MNRTAWERLIEKYADGRPVCNCGQAYYSTGAEYRKNGMTHHDGLFCKHGCSANQIDAKAYIARQLEGIDDVSLDD